MCADSSSAAGTPAPICGEWDGPAGPCHPLDSTRDPHTALPSPSFSTLSLVLSLSLLPLHLPTQASSMTAQIDHRTYPHIFSRILEHVTTANDLATMRALRGTCKDLAAALNPLLQRHVVFSLTDTHIVLRSHDGGAVLIQSRNEVRQPSAVPAHTSTEPYPASARSCSNPRTHHAHSPQYRDCRFPQPRLLPQLTTTPGEP